MISMWRTTISGLVFLLMILFLPSIEVTLQASEAKPFPYELNLATDLSLLLTGTAASGLSLYLYSSKSVPGRWETITLQKKHLNVLDRQAVGRRCKGAGEASDALTATAVAAPLFFTLPFLARNENMKALTLTTMYAEAMALTVGINGITKSLVRRNRPYMYVNNIFERSPRNRFSSSSFYSLHTSLAFGSMAFLSTIILDLYDSPLKYIAPAGSLVIAGLAGYFRFAAHLHFPTDIIAGAAIGGLIGYLIPAIHKLHSDAVTVSLVTGSINGIRVEMRI